MKKNDIVDYVINNTTLSRSQAIAAKLVLSKDLKNRMNLKE